jgi:hypothetical protein
MAERFLDLRRGERAEILQTLAVKLGRTPIVLEKDVWVCWTLAHLFAISGRQPMAFKGGTSLSKVYSAIARFSEDLDVTLDCRALVPDFDPFSEKATTSSRKNHRERLVKAMAKHVREVVDPALRTELERQFQDRCQAELELNAEKLWIHYESALPPAAGYIQRNVLIEFGGVNSLIPSEAKEIEPYLAGELPGLDFPAAQVDVLRPERTFWEKATLVHAECGRGELRPSREKLSRHWYDLSCLAEHDIGRRALADRALLVDVVKYKTVFYAAKHANYAACLEGRLRLSPPPAMMAGLQSDLEQMIAHGMFEDRPPPFDEIMERLRHLESAINKLE